MNTNYPLIQFSFYDELYQAFLANQLILTYCLFAANRVSAFSLFPFILTYVSCRALESDVSFVQLVRSAANAGA